MEREGFHVIPLQSFERSTQAPLKEIRSFIEIWSIYRRMRPDLVHHVALKLVIYGSLASILVRVRCTINALAGLGFLFTSDNRMLRFVRNMVLVLLRFLCNRTCTRIIVQNNEDLELLLSYDIAPQNHLLLISGSGVDIETFALSVEPAGKPIVMLASRMLWDKGIAEFVEAARQINLLSSVARFVLVGIPDPSNPASISQEIITTWVDQGTVEWWGHSSDMPATIALSSIVCLPSYREGLPKVLIEAAAIGRALVATDIAGCRPIVHHGRNGFLVPPKDIFKLAEAIKELLDKPILRREMGLYGRQLVVERFSDQKIACETFSLYDELLNECCQ